MFFRVGRDRYLEIGDALDPGRKIRRVLIAAWMLNVSGAGALGRIAAQGHDMPDAGFPIGADHAIDLLFCRRHAGQMGGRLERGLL